MEHVGGGSSVEMGMGVGQGVGRLCKAGVCVSKRTSPVGAMFMTIVIFFLPLMRLGVAMHQINTHLGSIHASTSMCTFFPIGWGSMMTNTSCESSGSAG